MAMAGGYLELDAALADQAGDEFLGAGLARHREHHGRDHGHGTKNHHILLDVRWREVQLGAGRSAECGSSAERACWRTAVCDRVSDVGSSPMYADSCSARKMLQENLLRGVIH